MGQIVIQPKKADREAMYQAQVVLCPLKQSAQDFDAIVEIASATQVPIFCHASDIPKLKEEGFGAYRFHKLEGYREVDFQGGAVEFFPAKKKVVGALASFFQEAGELLGFTKPYAYHVMIRPVNEKSILYLASSQLDSADIAVFKKLAPSIVVGSCESTRESWKVIGEQLNQNIIFEEDIESIVTTDFMVTENQLLGTLEVS